MKNEIISRINKKKKQLISIEFQDHFFIDFHLIQRKMKQILFISLLNLVINNFNLLIKFTYSSLNTKAFVFNQDYHKVKLFDIQTLTFISGQMTVGRRVSPILQVINFTRNSVH